MCRFTSSEPEIDSLIAVPRSCRSCLILSSTRSPLQARKLFYISSLHLRAYSELSKRRRSRSIFRFASDRSRLFVLFARPAANDSPPLSAAPPQLRPVREVLPASPLRVA